VNIEKTVDKHSNMRSFLVIKLSIPSRRILKGFKAPGLRPKNCRAAGLQEGKFRALGLRCFTPGLHSAKKSSFVRAPSQERLWAPNSKTKILELQGFRPKPPPPLATLITESNHFTWLGIVKIT